MNLNNLMCLSLLQIFILAEACCPIFDSWEPLQVGSWVCLICPHRLWWHPCFQSVLCFRPTSSPKSGVNHFSSKPWFSWPLERTICTLGGLTGIWSVIVSRPFQWAERGNMSSLFLKYKSIQFKFRTTEVLFNLFFIFYMINITICNAWHQYNYSLILPYSYKQCLKIATLPPPL